MDDFNEARPWLLYLTWDDTYKVNEIIRGCGATVKKLVTQVCESEMRDHTLECFHFEDDV